MKADRLEDGDTREVSHFLRVCLFVSTYLSELLGVVLLTIVLNLCMDLVIQNKAYLLNTDSIRWYLGLGATFVSFVVAVSILVVALLIALELTLRWEESKIID